MKMIYEEIVLSLEFTIAQNPVFDLRAMTGDFQGRNDGEGRKA